MLLVRSPGKNPVMRVAREGMKEEGREVRPSSKLATFSLSHDEPPLRVRNNNIDNDDDCDVKLRMPKRRLLLQCLSDIPTIYTTN